LQSELNLKSDLETATTFAGIAQGATDDTPKRSHNRKNARKGYDAVVNYMHRATVSEREGCPHRGQAAGCEKVA
jgi:hypothetical protein